MTPFVVLTPGALDGCGVDDLVPLPAAKQHHLASVLRHRPGQPVELTDGAGVVAWGRSEGAAVRLADAPRRSAPARPALHVAHALPKGRKLDEVVRILTELGVAGITAVASSRSVARLEGARRDKALTRWRAIARAAAEQARQPWLPDVAGPTDVAGLAAIGAGSPLLVAHPAAGCSLGDAVARLPHDPERVTIAVGPEGGWSDGEVAVMAAAGAVPVRLDGPVLRTEHAAVVLVAVIAYALGRWK